MVSKKKKNSLCCHLKCLENQGGNPVDMWHAVHKIHRAVSNGTLKQVLRVWTDSESSKHFVTDMRCLLIPTPGLKLEDKCLCVQTKKEENV